MRQPSKIEIREAPAGKLVTLHGLFTPAELDAIEAYGDGLTPLQANIGAGDSGIDHIRITRVAWIAPHPQIEWLFDHIEKAVMEVNSRLYKYDLYGLRELFQYTVYQSAEGGHYNWHVDSGTDQRKLSLTLQLSNPLAYQGGDLVLETGQGPFTADRTRGAVTFFPSHMMHRVTPVTAGIRKSVVVWVAGPPYR